MQGGVPRRTVCLFVFWKNVGGFPKFPLLGRSWEPLESLLGLSGAPKSSQNISKMAPGGPPGGLPKRNRHSETLFFEKRAPASTGAQFSRPLLEPLGVLLAALGARSPGALLGPSWAALLAALQNNPKPSSWGALGALVGSSWGLPGPSWSPPGACLGPS